MGRQETMVLETVDRTTFMIAAAAAAGFHLQRDEAAQER